MLNWVLLAISLLLEAAVFLLTVALTSECVKLSPGEPRLNIAGGSCHALPQTWPRYLVFGASIAVISLCQRPLAPRLTLVDHGVEAAVLDDMRFCYTW